MDRALQVLKAISENEIISQRKLAQLLDCSLGTTNAIVKQLVKEGAIIIEEVTSNKVRYVITNKGLVVKADKSYKELVTCYSVISDMKEHIKQVIYHLHEEGYKHFYIDGKKDEVYRLLKIIMIEARRDLEIICDDYTEECVDILGCDCILYWDISKKYTQEITVKNIFVN